MITTEQLFDTRTLLAWAKAKPASEEYSYFNEPKCVLTTYFYENGYDYEAAPDLIYKKSAEGNSEEIGVLPKGWNRAVHGDGDWTYGQLVERLERLIRQE